jgi:collagenase-like PrtC family protease/putative sterol carrier protein
MKISVGPAPSHWGRERIESFYRELARCPVDYVYLGETACPIRSCFSPDFVDKLCDELTQAGKKVYVSSLALVRNEEQYRAFRNLTQQVQHIEINSPAFLGFARCYHAVTGMFLNVYNSATANILAKHKVERIMLPCELNFQSIASIAKRCTAATELIVHGYIPIGISSTCQTTRSLGRNGDGCEKVCQHYPEGMVLNAGDRAMFRIDGPQTLSVPSYCLVEYLQQLTEAGVDTIRILPQWNHTDRIVQIYKDVLEHRRHCADAVEELKAISTSGLCNGWFFGKAGWVYKSPNIPHTSKDVSSRPFVPLEKQTETEDATFGNYCCTWSDDDILCELNKLVEVMNNDSQFIECAARFKGTTVVLSATDTKRSYIIKLDKQGVHVHSYINGPFDVKIQAIEQVLWKVLSGQMDADAAFFAGKASVSGSVFTAFRVKNKFLSLLQKHITHKLEVKDKSFVNH